MKILPIVIISFALLFSLVSSICNPASSGDPSVLNKGSFEEITMVCMDKVSIGGKLETVINSHEEYENLIYERFDKPLSDYWNANYNSVLQMVIQQHPGLTQGEYEILVKDIFYSALPFRGTENCSHPQINFASFTLLGQDANCGGCDVPEYKIEVEKNNIAREFIYRIFIKRNGDCEAAFLKNKWILVPKIPPDYIVKFEKIEL